MSQTQEMSVEQQAWMEAMQPSDGHKKLEPMVGTFNATVKMWMEPGAEPSVSQGVMTNSWALGGRYIEHRYEGQSFGMPFQGKGFMGFDNTTKKYQGLWIDTASTMMQFEQGDFDAQANTFTMRGSMTCPSTNQPFDKRSVVTIKDNDHHTMEMFFKGPDGNEMKNMEIEYTRAS